MVGEFEWIDKDLVKSLSIKPPKKITGTRLAAILGKNPYNTPFSCWADMLHVYEKPFEDNKYTIAGKTIEPKQAQFMINQYGMTNLKTPTQLFGEDYFNVTHGNFFSNEIFGGMWDYILVDKNNIPVSVLEMKTTKNRYQWKYEPPFYYTLQASLYAYLLNVDIVYLVVTYLNNSDYENPENVILSLDNTEVFCFSMNKKFKNFKVDYIDKATEWWNTYILTNTSPKITSSDKEIVEILEKKLYNSYKGGI